MKKNIKPIIIFFSLLILYGCSPSKAAIRNDSSNATTTGFTTTNTQASPNTNGSTAGSVTTDMQTNSITNTGRDVWEAFCMQMGDNPINSQHSPQDPDFYYVYLDGLSHQNPSVRWYCSYKLLEYLNSDKNDEIIPKLNNLLKDEIDFVRNAAKFSLEIFNKTFNGPEFKKSPVNSNVAFFKFSELRYNDGDVWLYSEKYKETVLLKKADGSVMDLKWSPDGNKLCIEYGGRIWSDVTIIDDINDTQELHEPKLMQYISEHNKEFKYEKGKNQRPDPYITLLEWSPDSKKALLFYSFTDDNYIVQRGSAVYDLTKKQITKVYPYPPFDGDHPPHEKPEGFTWK